MYLYQGLIDSKISFLSNNASQSLYYTAELACCIKVIFFFPLFLCACSSVDLDSYERMMGQLQGSLGRKRLRTIAVKYVCLQHDSVALSELVPGQLEFQYWLCW